MRTLVFSYISLFPLFVVIIVVVVGGGVDVVARLQRTKRTQQAIKQASLILQDKRRVFLDLIITLLFFCSLSLSL